MTLPSTCTRAMTFESFCKATTCMTPMHCIQIKTQQDALTGQCVLLTATATHARTHTYTYTRARAHTHTHTHTHPHTHTHARLLTRTHTHEYKPPPFTFRKLQATVQGIGTRSEEYCASRRSETRPVCRCPPPPSQAVRPRAQPKVSLDPKP